MKQIVYSTFAIILFIASFNISNLCFAQTPVIQWQQTYGGSDIDRGDHIQQTRDSGFIAIGSTKSTDEEVTGNHGFSDIWVIKLNSTGALVWEKCIGSAYDDFGYWIQQTSDGGYILTGWTASNPYSGDVTSVFGNADVWVVKLNDTGNIVWQHTYGGSQNDAGVCIRQTADGGYIVACNTESSDYEVTGYHGGTGADFWILKINDTGDIQWEKCYGGSGSDYPSSIQQTSDSGYIIAGLTASTDGDITYNHGGSFDYWVVKINDTGKLLWQNTYGGSGDDEACAILQTTDGGYITTGFSNSIDFDVTGNHGSYDFWTLKLNDTGGIIWEKCYGGSNDDDGESIQQTSDSGFIVIGPSTSSDFDVAANYGSSDIWVVKTDKNGTIQWQKNLGGDSTDDGSGIIQTFDNGYAAIGFTRSFDHDVTYNHGASDFWVVKLESTASISTIAKTDRVQIYPNPASTTLIISASGKINSVAISNVLGQVVASPDLSKGEEVVRINVAALPAGVYFVKVNGSEVRKFVKE